MNCVHQFQRLCEHCTTRTEHPEIASSDRWYKIQRLTLTASLVERLGRVIN